jgi:hypothetical protein
MCFHAQSLEEKTTNVPWRTFFLLRLLFSGLCCKTSRQSLVHAFDVPLFSLCCRVKGGFCAANITPTYKSSLISSTPNLVKNTPL